MINLALMGAGRMGKCHADELKSIDGAIIAGVFDPDAEAAGKFAETYDVKKIYASESELFQDDSIDGVLVCNFSDQHFETLSGLLAAGKKKIFCEKALVRKLEDGEKLLQLAEKAGATIMVGHHRRYQGGYVELKRMVDAGELGRIRMAKVHYCHPGYVREWGDFFADFDRSGGVILDMMSHLFDQLNWYFGEPVSVSGNSVMSDRSQPLPMDYVSGTVTYGDNIICGIDGSWQRYGVASDRIEIYGDSACAIYNGGDTVDIYRKNEHTERKTGKAKAYNEQMKAFVDMVANNTPPVNSLYAGFTSAKLALTMIDACKQQKTLRF
ncbi:MAG: Gfo/Idh/MocA family oxidoreductase [Victivallales bacterium]|nr:Gfo/Idh/MocA family oxidoreductase [Victivallales bacterium]